MGIHSQLICTTKMFNRAYSGIKELHMLETQIYIKKEECWSINK